MIWTFQDISYGSGQDLVEIVSSIPWYWKILIPAIDRSVVGPLIFFLLVGMLKKTDMIVACNNAVLRRSIEGR